MKKTYKLILAAIAASMVFSSCTKDMLDEQGKNGIQSEGTRVISVSFGNQTRTALGEDGLTPRFTGNEIIRVSNGSEYQDCEVNVDDNDMASFFTNLEGTLTAVYPSTAAKMDGNAITGIQIAATQTGKFADANICMAENITGNEATFHNKTAILRFYVDASIGVESLTIQHSGMTSGDQITVTAPDGETLADVTDDLQHRICYVAVNEKINASALTFTSHTRTQGDVTKQSTANVTFKAGMMYNAFIPYYIDLGTAGKWAYCNIGAFLPEEAGYYFSWGNTEGHWLNGVIDDYSFSEGNYNSSSAASLNTNIEPDSDYDAAHVNWGGNWRMPTIEAFRSLMETTYLKVTDHPGMTFSNENKTVFFPKAVAGADQEWCDDGGYYWSSTYNTGSSFAGFLYFDSDLFEDYDNPYYGMSIRPVYDESAFAPDPDSNLSTIKDAIETLRKGKTVVEITSPTDIGTPVVLPSETDGKNISISILGVTDSDITFQLESGAKGPASLSIDTDAQNLTINCPNSHVEVNGGNYQTVTATTSASTLVVGKEVTIENLNINGGNAEIRGLVSKVTRQGKESILFSISTPGTLVRLAELVNGGNVPSCSAVLTEDIDLSGKKWKSIDTNSRLTSFDGKGHTIKNMNVDTDNAEDWAGFIGKAFSDFTISNVTFTNAELEWPGSAMLNARGGIVVGSMYKGDIINCHVKNSHISAFQKLGGIVGCIFETTSDVTIKDCTVDGLNMEYSLEDPDGSYTWQAGGIAGYVTTCGNRTFENCSVKNITVKSPYNGSDNKAYFSHAFVGNLITYGSDCGSKTVTFKGNSVDAQLSGVTSGIYSSDFFAWADNKERVSVSLPSIIIDGTVWTPDYSSNTTKDINRF